jgi:hypothetical protein
MKKAFRKLAETTVLHEPEWLTYTNKAGPMPKKHARTLTVIAQFYFYLGYFDQARAVSLKSSIYLEDQAHLQFSKGYVIFGISDLFDSALYRSLAQEDAQSSWQDLIKKSQNLSDELVLRQNHADIWVYQAYALMRVKRYSEVTEPAKKGFDGIMNGSSIYKIPQKNSRTYGLVNVLETLSSYQLSETPAAKREARAALLSYKNENFAHSRSGYDIIFDLQFCYPDVFDSILPGTNPDED